MRVVACSPYTKLFIPAWEERLLENPDLILDTELDFEFSVKRPTGAVAGIKYGVPFRADDYLKDTVLKAEGDNLLYYLTGGKDGSGSQETDFSGIVELSLGRSSESAVAEMAHAVMLAEASKDEKRITKAKKQMEELMRSTYAETKDAMASARNLANERVVRQLRTTHVNLMNQYKHNKEDGKGLYAPSCTEHFGAYVLRKIMEVSKGRREMNSEFKKLINDVWVN